MFMRRKRSPRQKRIGEAILLVTFLGFTIGGGILFFLGGEIFSLARLVFAGITAAMVMVGLELCASDWYSRNFFMSPEDMEKKDEEKRKKEESV